MVLISSHFLFIAFIAVAANAGKITWDGRLPRPIISSLYDIEANSFPSRLVHIFDDDKTGTRTILLGDESAFISKLELAHDGFRRSELLPANPPAFEGITTFHFTIGVTDSHPLHYWHEYQMMFLEAQDGSHIFELMTGTPYENVDHPVPSDHSLYIRLLTNNGPTNFTKFFRPNHLHNFAISIDWTKATLSAFYSDSLNPLEEVVTDFPIKVPAKQKKQAEFHVGLVKLPVGRCKNVVTDGYQEGGVIEDFVVCSVFIEDSTDGVVCLDMNCHQ